MPASPLPEIFGRYRIIKLLGSGAMGAVYLAADTQLERQVAIKVPTFDGDAEGENLARFYREARIAATLRHPNICAVHDVGAIDGRHYISMAYLDGQPLSEIIKTNGPHSERSALYLIRKLALALHEAHRQGIVHRDLKPANVMIDGKREPVIMDFGLACQVRNEDSRLTQQGVVMGSPAYMAPEQMEGDSTRIAAAADQYSLGVILFELLTGQLPYRGTVSAVINQVATKPTPAISSLRNEIDPRINAFCLRMMAKSAGERFPSMKAVAEEITRILAASSPKTAEKPTATASIKSSKATETVVSDRDRWSTELPTLFALAKDLYRKHDYAETRKVLAKIPAGVRTPEIEQLFADAADKDDECCLLLSDIEQSLQQQTPTDLRPMLKRFLKLKPGHKSMQQLARDIDQHGVEKAFKIRRRHDQFIDPAGRTVEPKHIALAIGGLFTLCAAVYFAASAYEAPRGKVIVNIADPKITVTFADQKVTEAESGQEFSLKPEEEKELRLDVHGVSITEATRKISVTKNETKTITASLEADGSLKIAIAETKQTFVVADAAKKAVKPDDANSVATKAEPIVAPAAVQTSIAKTSPTTTPREAVPTEKPKRRILFVDDYDKPQSYWNSTTPQQLKENPNHQWGYRDGTYFDEVKAPSWFFGYVPGGPFQECTWELSSRITGDNANSRGAVVLHLNQSNRGIQIRMDGTGTLWIAPSSVTFDQYSAGPWVGPITNRAIRPGGSGYNKIRLDIRKRQLDIYVNDVAVVSPLEFAWDLTPVSLGMGVDCQSPSVRAEHDRIEIGELREPLKTQDGSAPKPIQILANGAAVLPDGTHCYEGAALKVASVTGGGTNPQWDLQMFQGIWTNDCQQLWWGAKNGSVLTFDVPIEASGLYQIVPGFTLGPDFGRFKFALDGQPLYGDKPIDLFDPRVQPATPVSLGTLPLTPGNKKLTVTIIGKNRGSTGFVLGLDELRLIPVR
jgi:serine/threonine protein kinase